jgi:hypothetical protein
MLPTNFPPWAAVHQQTQRWIDARCFEAMVHDLLALLRVAEGRDPDPTAVVLDGRTLRSTPKSGHRAGYDGHKRIRGSKVHPGRRPGAGAGRGLGGGRPGGDRRRGRVGLRRPGCTGADPALDVADHGVRLEVVKLEEAKRGFVLLPRRWVFERSFA